MKKKKNIKYRNGGVSYDRNKLAMHPVLFRDCYSIK